MSFYNIFIVPCDHFSMIGQYTTMLIAIILALVNPISVIGQSQNETSETNIGENQSISGRISGFGGGLDFGPRIIDDPSE